MPHLSYGGGNFPAHPLAPSVTLLRDKLLLDFSHSLTSKGTPPAILWDILHGFSAWLTPDSSHARAHTFGSLLTAGIALTSAFYEQYHKLGWYQTCWGRITRGWSKALEEYNIQAGTTLESQYWSSSLIENLRVLTMGLWRHRNQIEHGDSIEEQARVLLTTLQNQVMDLYSEFSTNPSFILLRHHYLFEHRTLAERLDMSYDSLQAWVRSVQEAIRDIGTWQWQQIFQQSIHAYQFQLFLRLRLYSHNGNYGDNRHIYQYLYILILIPILSFSSVCFLTAITDHWHISISSNPLINQHLKYKFPHCWLNPF